jgi:hypothetical protein
MPLVLLDDLIDGSMAEIGSQGSIVTRGGFAHYTPASDQPVDSAGVIADVYERIKGNGKPFGSVHPRFPNLGLTRIPITPLGAGQFRYQLVYELVNPGSFGANSAYITEESSTIQNYTTTFMPGTREAIRVGFTTKDANFNPQGTSTYDQPAYETVPDDFVPMNLIRPVRTIRVTEVRFGKPKGNISSYVGYVNSDTWKGLPKGYWMLMEYATRSNRMEGFYTTAATVYSKNTEDWSETGVLTNTITGKKAKIADSDLKIVRTAQYQPQKIIKYNGLVHVMPYPWTSFRALLGFS